MPFDQTLIRDTAKANGWRPEDLEKTLRLLEYLHEVGQDGVLGKCLSLRGGSAINLFFENAPRLSIDADFNYIGELDPLPVKQKRQEAQTRLEEIGRRLSYEIRQRPGAYALESFYLRYTSTAGSDKLKIETNYLMRLPLLPPEMREATTLIKGLGARLLLCSEEEVYAGKVKALVERAAPRDVFDVYRMVKHKDFVTTRRFLRLTTVFLATLRQDPRALSAATVDWPDEPRLKSELGSYVRESFMPAIDEMLGVARTYVGDVLKFDAEQQAFLGAVVQGKSGYGALLFPGDLAMAAKVEAHPAVLWKVQNVRDHLAGRKRKREK